MSNQNVLSPEINAVIDTDEGKQVFVTVPIKSDVRRGDRVLLLVQSDKENYKRKRYIYHSEIRTR